MELTSATPQGSGSPDLAKLSVGALLIVSCSASNSAIVDEDHSMPSRKVAFNQNLNSDIGSSLVGEVPGYEAPMDAVSSEEAIEVFSEFVANLTANMVAAPANVHREIAQRPWDFV